MSAAAPAVTNGDHKNKAEKKETVKKVTAGDKKGGKKAKPKTEKKATDFDVSHIEYILLDPALDTNAKGTVRKDRRGGTSAGAARTDRLRNSRLFRTGQDRVTIQTPQGEEIVFHTSVLEKMLERSKALAITREIPTFS